MNAVLNILRGIVIGIANVIPGVSGGTMAVSMGIYDKLISAVTGLFKHFKQSMKLLIPLGVGMLIGVVGFGFLLEYLLDNFVLATCLTFVGLILGGLPILWMNLRRNIEKKPSRSIGAGEVISFLVLLAIGIGLPLVQGAEGAIKTLTIDPRYHCDPVPAGADRQRYHGHPRRVRQHGAHGAGVLQHHPVPGHRHRDHAQGRRLWRCGA